MKDKLPGAQWAPVFLVQKLYWRFLGIESGYRKRKWNKISRAVGRRGYKIEKEFTIPSQ